MSVPSESPDLLKAAVKKSGLEINDSAGPESKGMRQTVDSNDTANPDIIPDHTTSAPTIPSKRRPSNSELTDCGTKRPRLDPNTLDSNSTVNTDTATAGKHRIEAPVEASKKRPINDESTDDSEVKRLRPSLDSDETMHTNNQDGVQSTTTVDTPSNEQAETTKTEEKTDRRIFRIMDLPAEVRIEIYRACLTRPFNVFISKRPPPRPQAETDRITEMQTASRAQAQAQARTSPRRASQRLATAAQHQRQQAMLANAIALNRQPLPRLRNGVPTAQRQIVPKPPVVPRPPRPDQLDPLLVNILRVSKLIYKEARPIMYGENVFELDMETAVHSMAGLHQRSRSTIRFMHLTIPNHSEILERFAEIVRLSIRYCWGLLIFTINMPFTLPANNGNGAPNNTAVYANAFDILRWLPKKCKVVLEGDITDEIRRVVQRNATLAENLDELAYARRQLIANDSERDILAVEAASQP